MLILTGKKGNNFEASRKYLHGQHFANASIGEI